MIEPPGLDPPERVAWSEIEPPIVALAVAEVVMVGVAWATTDVSFESLHGVMTPALLVSPE